MKAESTGTLTRLLARIRRPLPPAAREPVGRLCYSCRRPLNAGAFPLDGRDYCDERCAPTYLRKKAKREQLESEDALYWAEVMR